jgi:hypothetical protein
MWSNSRGKVGDVSWSPSYNDLERMAASEDDAMNYEPHWLEYVVRNRKKEIKINAMGIDMADGKLLKLIKNNFWWDNFHYDEKKYLEDIQHISSVNQLSLNVE